MFSSKIETEIYFYCIYIHNIDFVGKIYARQQYYTQIKINIKKFLFIQNKCPN